MVICRVLGEDADGPAAAMDVNKASLGDPAGAIEGAPSVAEGESPASEGVIAGAAACALANASGPALKGDAPPAMKVVVGKGAAGASAAGSNGLGACSDAGENASSCGPGAGMISST